MTFTEKSNWVVVVASILALLGYAVTIVPAVQGKAIPDVDFARPMIYTIVGFIVLNIVGNIVAAATNPTEADKKDQRDKEIDRYGDRIGNWVGIAGACAGLFLAMARQDYFWIANSIFVMGLLGGLLGASLKVAAYHGPFQRW